MEHVVISLINYNGAKNTNACLASLQTLSLEDTSLEIVVIDNASLEPFSVDKHMLQKFPIHVIENSVNKGFSGGHNYGIRHGLKKKADYILILNNDTVVDRNLVKALIKSIKQGKKVGIVSPKIYFKKGSEFYQDRYTEKERGKVIWYAGGKMDWENVIGKHRGVDQVDTGQFDTSEEVGLATGCCMLITRQVIERVGMFDERYFLYYEDADYSERAKQKGFRIFYEPNAYLWHANAGSTGGSGSQLQDYFISRNRMLFGLTYAPIKTKLALLKESVRLLISGRPWQKKGIQDFYLKRFGKGSYIV